MDRGLFAEITALAMARMSSVGFSMPCLRFFTPLDTFWPLLDRITRGRTAQVVEVGAGSGDMHFDGLEHGYDIRCIDTMARDGRDHVLMADATSFHYPAGSLVLCCRPDHSGWAGYALEQALSCGASFAYVGLRHNFHRDLTESQLDDIPYQTADEIGEEGEVLLGWGPLFDDLATQ